jgi:hypothetical protein
LVTAKTSMRMLESLKHLASVATVQPAPLSTSAIFSGEMRYARRTAIAKLLVQQCRTAEGTFNSQGKKRKALESTSSEYLLKPPLPGLPPRELALSVEPHERVIVVRSCCRCNQLEEYSSNPASDGVVQPGKHCDVCALGDDATSVCEAF